MAIAVKPATRIRLGDALAALGSSIGLTDEDFKLLKEPGTRCQHSRWFE